MNYYQHHLGDYLKDTAHLNMLEDGAYRRLLDRYYGTEAGIPADQAHRIARARTREEKAAVDAVLQEFFTLEDGVWKNGRAEEEIAKFASKRPDAEKKRENDKERQRRARERRKALFEELSGLGIHMAWNATAEELHTALEQAKSQGGHAPVTPPVTRDNTATQSPDTNTQSPLPSTQVCKDTQGTGSPTRAGAVCVALRAEGLASVNPAHPDLIALLDDGAEIQEFVSAARIAREKGKGFAYVIGIVKGQRADAQRMAAEAKTKTRQGANHDGHDVEEPA